MASNRFKPARFGNAAVNTVTGELIIEGATVISAMTVTGSETIPDDVSLVLCDNQSGGHFILTIPDIADVPIGHIIGVKDAVGNFGLFQRCTISGDANIDASAQLTLAVAWRAATICSDGTKWNIISYFGGAL